MTTRARWLVSTVVILSVLSCPGGQALAWGTLTHQWICSQLRQGNSYFHWAGAYPDMALLNSDLADHLHSPLPKRGAFGLTGMQRRNSANFAALWLDKTNVSPNPDPDVAEREKDILDGWGCHIAADWMAHSWLPLTLESDPSRSSADLVHMTMEYAVDAFVAYKENYLPRQPYVLRLNPAQLRALVISHALTDYASVDADGKLWRSFRTAWVGRPVFDAWLWLRAYGAFPEWLQINSALVRRSLASFAIADARGELDSFEAVVRPKLEKSIELCAQWLDKPMTPGIPGDIEVDPLYDPTIPPPPPSPGPPPPPPIPPFHYLAELLQGLSELAVERNLMDLQCSETPEPGVSEFAANVPDEAALDEFVATTLSELAQQPASVATDQTSDEQDDGGLSEGARLLARAFDRIINEGIVDPELAADVFPPCVVPITPEPDDTVWNLAPTISAEVVDPYPSCGLDADSLEVYLDGIPLEVTLSSAGTFEGRPSWSLGVGYHEVRTTVADLFGQSTEATWRFAVSLDLEWLPPIGRPSGRTWKADQTVPLAFTLRDDKGDFGVEPKVKVVLSDPLDKTGSRSVVYEVGEGSDHIRIEVEEERYIVNVKLKDLGWATPGTTVAVRVEAGGLTLGETALEIR